MSNTLTGRIHFLSEPQTKGNFTFRKVIVEVTDDKFPQHIELQLSGNNVDKLNGARVGETVTLTYNLRGRLWTDPKSGEEKCFNTLDVWKVERQNQPSTTDYSNVKKADVQMPEPFRDVPF